MNAIPGMIRLKIDCRIGLPLATVAAGGCARHPDGSPADIERIMKGIVFVAPYAGLLVLITLIAGSLSIALLAGRSRSRTKSRLGKSASPLLDDEVALLLDRLERASEGRFPVFDVVAVVCATMLLGGLTICAGGIIGARLGLATLAALGLAAFTARRLTLSSEQRRIAEALSEHNDLRIVSALILTLEWPDTRHYNAVAGRLSQLLAQIGPGDCNVLTERTRHVLHRWLRRPDSVLHIPILQALGRVGDERAIPPVESLTRMRPRTSREAELRDAAISCLLALQSRHPHSKALLLRPSEQPEGNGLLRAVGGAADPPQDDLLRATADE